MSCEQCIKESRTDRSFTRPPLQSPNEHITALEDAMQNDLVPESPPSGGYENIVSAMDVLSRIFFAYPANCWPINFLSCREIMLQNSPSINCNKTMSEKPTVRYLNLLQVTPSIKGNENLMQNTLCVCF